MKSVNKAAVQQSEHSVATVLLETVAPKSKVHRAVVTKLLEIVSNKTTIPKKRDRGTTSSNEEKGIHFTKSSKKQSIGWYYLRSYYRIKRYICERTKNSYITL